MSFLYSNTLRVLAAGLDVAAARHTAISNNVANQNTPGYKATDIDFSATMRQALGGSAASALQGKTTRSGHLKLSSALSTSENVRLETTDNDSASWVMRLDGNSVDVDLEMAKMAENSLLYDAMAQMVQSNFSMLKHVISEGRR